MNGYRKSDMWAKVGEGFKIEVKRWDILPQGKETNIIGLPSEIWNYYCYIYPNHPLFEQLKEEDNFCLIANKLPFHGGVTFCEWYRDNEKINSKCYGCDYIHYWDNHFNRMPYEYKKEKVFNDAEELFKVLSQQEGE